MPGTEIAERISAGVSKPWHFPGERGEPGARGCGPVGEAGVRRGEGGVPPAGWNFNDRYREMAATEEIRWEEAGLRVSEVFRGSALPAFCIVSSHTKILSPKK